jgi:REP element-mobilizing transposase RayT
MKRKRIKRVPEEGEAYYHVITRTVDGERFFGEQEKEVLRKQLWQVAEYCGVEILTYVILSNHYHVLLRVPQKVPVGDEELLRRYEVLYPKPKQYQPATLKVIRAKLEANGPEAEEWRKRQMAQMGDVSGYMKLVNQLFATWFNKSRKRRGHLWGERFTSTYVEGGVHLLGVAAYIDLNAVRAGLVKDPKDYRYCGYAEALAGHGKARQGVSAIVGEPEGTALAAYRIHLFNVGSNPHEGKAAITEEAFQKVYREGGELDIPRLWRHRIRTFTQGAVLGSHAFVEKALAEQKALYGRKRGLKPRPLGIYVGEVALYTLRRSLKA